VPINIGTLLFFKQHMSDDGKFSKKGGPGQISYHH